MEYKFKYKLLALATLAKFSRSNSILQYSWESDSQCATRLKLNMNTYKKYKNACIEKGLLLSENNNLRFLSIPTILTILNDGVVKERNLMFNKALRFYKFWKYNKKVTFKIIYNQIVESILIKNFEQQKYKINLTKKLKTYFNSNEDSCTRNDDYYSILKEAKKTAASKNMSVEKYIESTSKNLTKIVTGKNHAANLIKMSPATSTRILKRMQSKETIRKFVKTKDLGYVSCQEQYENLPELNAPGYVAITKGSKAKHFLGSVIFLNIPSFTIPKKYNKPKFTNLTSEVGIKK